MKYIDLLPSTNLREQISFINLDVTLAGHRLEGEAFQIRLDITMHTDPEEGWTKPVFVVHSGLEDFDEVMDLEDKFFANATDDSTLVTLLPLVIVLQA